jgi:FkbH-like protein
VDGTVSHLVHQLEELITRGAGGPDASEPRDWQPAIELALLVARLSLDANDTPAASRALEYAASQPLTGAQREQAAAQFLRLGRVSSSSRDTQGEQARLESEGALRKASELDPAHGLPALAQHLQRHGELDEAITCWREACRLNHADSSMLMQLGRALEQSGRPEEALGVYLDLVSVAPSAQNYLNAARRIDQLSPHLPAAAPGQTIRIALLGNATLDHVERYLKVACYRAGLRPVTYLGGFDQYTQEILDPESGLYRFAPEVLILAVHPSRLFPRLHSYPFDLSLDERRAEMESGLGALQSLLDAFTQRSSALVLVHNMPVPQHRALGVQDLRDELGQAAIFTEINLRLAEMARTRYRNVYVLDEEHVQARSGKERATDARMWHTARLAWSEHALAGLTQAYMRYIKPYKSLGRKCIVLDLDNTLWGGVVGEDGVAGIKLGAEAPGNSFVAFQRELEKLWRRGILLAICSKNNLDDVMPVLNDHPDMVLRPSHFAALRINWDPKEVNIASIARELNIGIDSLVFLDDSPVERARVRAALPQVLTPELPADPALYRQALLELDIFESLALTEEDRNRSRLYAEERVRREFEETHQAGASLEDYLAQLDIVVDIDMSNEQTLPRVAQLTKKTNQFNLTTRRYDEAQIVEMQSQGCRVYTLRVADRFGDNGLVGVAIVAPAGPEAWELDTLLLSCRVMGRGVETALLAAIAREAMQGGVEVLQGWYLPTAKNVPAKDCYSRHGFALAETTAEGGELWKMRLDSSSIAVPAWLTVRSKNEQLALS